MKRTKILILLLSLCLATAYGQIIHVPADYDSIQKGIDAASNGDTVLVDPGTYYENINYKGKGITLASKYLLEKDSVYIYNTIIDGSQPHPGDSGSVVVLVSGEDTTSILYGFTITGGTGSINPPHPTIKHLKTGGGIFMYGAGGKILHNIITDNNIESEYEAFGGGLDGVVLPEDNMIIFEENLVYNNSVTGKIWVKGGGVCIAWCHARIKNNIIRNNMVYADSIIDYVAAGGLWYSQSDELGYVAKVNISGNTIESNEIHVNRSSTHGTMGGGLAVWGTNDVLYANISNNVICHNQIWSDKSVFGNGACFNVCDSIEIYGNEIYSNCDSSLISIGGGMCIWNSPSSVLVQKNIIYENIASKGGGIYIGQQEVSDVVLDRNTIYGNVANNKGGGIFFYNSNCQLNNSIIWGNIANNASSIFEEFSNILSVDYCNVGGGWPGTGNIDQYPLFEDTASHDFHLLVNSPCLDTGDPLLFDPDGSIVDIGAYYFDHRPVQINPVLTSTSTSFVLNWTACEGAVSYLADLSYDPSFNQYVNAYHNFNVGDTTSFEFTGLTSGTTYYVRLRANYFMGRSGYSNTEIIIELNNEEELLPSTIFTVYPNPFKSSVNVRFTLAEKGFVEMYVYKVLGEKLILLPETELSKGEHTVPVYIPSLPSGMYFLRIINGNKVVSKKIIKQ